MPSPTDHMTDVGVAVALTETPGTDAAAETGSHALDTHSHVGRFTNCSAAGLDAILGGGNRNWLRASAASSAGEISGASPECCSSGTHFGAR
ncbi:hypothetical protein [Amycolatopsis pigmentata]|uniref:Uncharacterized protein n=1 Tax=Amycolatopsis pigmentata TaxID=450801 RepID=A0ABW5FME2_9PSEU